MQIDRKTLQYLQNMDDAKLTALLQKIAQGSGISPAVLGADPNDLRSIRAALGSATEADLQKINDLYAAYRRGERGGGK